MKFIELESSGRKLKIHLIHQDASGVKHTSTRSLTYLQLIKHLSFAGLGGWWGAGLVSRYLGNFLEFHQYYGFFGGALHLPPPFQSDPTERNYLSNRMGRAIADYLCKDLYKAKYTHSYEGAMQTAGHLVTGERPDFYCDTGTQTFAVEAKGFSVASVSENKMAIHKAQSASGPIPVNFSIASVAYDLYSDPKVKFYDPPSREAAYNKELNNRLRSIYYSSVLDFIREGGWFSDAPSSEGGFDRFISLRRRHRVDILLSKGIYQHAWQDAEWGVDVESSLDNNRYIDLDGVGLELVQG